MLAITTAALISCWREVADVILQCIGLILGRDNVNILYANLPFPITGESWHWALSLASSSNYEDSKYSAIAGCVASVSSTTWEVLPLPLPLLLEIRD